MPERLSKVLDISSAFRTEIVRSRAGMRIVVDGVLGIDEFTDEQITLKNHGGRVKICGKRLSLCVFEGRAAEIKGRVEDISFSYGKIK